MKAMVIDGHFGLDNLQLIDRPVPTPRRGEIIVRMRAASINYRDTDMAAGTYPIKFPLPLCPTSDGVGDIVAVGEDVRRGAVGDRMLGAFWQSWIGGDFDQTDNIEQLGGDMERGIPIGSRESFERMNRAISLHKMRPVVDRVFPWTEARAALAYMREAKHFGKIVLKF